jgi:thiamine-phosphate pyrophosphorylase
MSSDLRLYLVLPVRLDLPAISAALPGVLGAGDIACVRLPDQGSPFATQAAIAALRPLVQARDIAFVVEADAALAKAEQCDGVHLTGSAAQVRGARALLTDGIVGFSAGTNRHDAMEAGELGADYVEFSTVDTASWWAELFEVPCVAMAEDSDDVADALDTAIDFVSVGAWIWVHAEGAAAAVGAVQAVIDGATSSAGA